MKLRLNLRLTIIFTVFLVIFSCEKSYLSDNSCNVSNPMEELGWLKTKIQNYEQLSPDASKYYYVSMAKYNKETVFLEGYCNPAANYVIPVINCTGERIGILGEIDFDSLSDMKIIWKSKNSECLGN